MKLKNSIVRKLTTDAKKLGKCTDGVRSRSDYNRVRISGAETTVFIFISRFQDNTGNIEGIYYKDIMEGTGYKHSQVYFALHNLEELGYIKISKSDSTDMDILICNNDFSDGNFYDGYIKVNKKIFTSGKFFKLSAFEQLIFLEFLLNTAKTGLYTIKLEYFFKSYQERYGVARQTLCKYMRRLKEYFNIYLKNGIYFIKELKGKVSGTKIEQRAEIEYTERKQLHKLHVRKALRRNKVEGVTDKLKDELMTILRQYSRSNNKVPFDLSSIVHRCQQILNNEKKIISRVINVKLVHKLVKQTIADLSI